MRTILLGLVLIARPGILATVQTVVGDADCRSCEASGCLGGDCGDAVLSGVGLCAAFPAPLARARHPKDSPSLRSPLTIYASLDTPRPAPLLDGVFRPPRP